MEKRKTPKRIVGVVSSDRMNKTIAVEIERLVKHKKYGKYIRRTTRYKAHDPHNQAHVGDLVEVEASRPLSKTKRWRLVRIMRRAHSALQQTEQETQQTAPEQEQPQAATG